MKKSSNLERTADFAGAEQVGLRRCGAWSGLIVVVEVARGSECEAQPASSDLSVAPELFGSSFTRIRSELRKFKSWGVKGPDLGVSAGMVSVVSWVASLSPIVASSTSMTSKPSARILRTTPAIWLDSATVSWMASPSCSMRLRILRFKFSLPAPERSRFSYHTLVSTRGQCRTARLLHFFCVDKVRLGRRLGIGTRLAAKVLREQAHNVASAGNASSPAPAAQRHPEPARPRAEANPRPVETRSAVPSSQFVRKAAQGGRGFGRAFWKTFSAAGRALWHEVTGLFFALFALFFAQSLWRLRNAWRFGPEHRHFEIDLVMTVIFLYFSISAFVRSRRAPQ